MSKLENFLNCKGKIVSWPAKKSIQEEALYYISTKSVPKIMYTEKQVNEIINEWHLFDDYAIIRRELIIKKFLGRNDDGSLYWLENRE